MKPFPRIARRNFVISGHGGWFHEDGYFTIPQGCTIVFYSPIGTELHSQVSVRLQKFDFSIRTVPGVAKKNESSMLNELTNSNPGDFPRYLDEGVQCPNLSIVGWSSTDSTKLLSGVLDMPGHVKRRFNYTKDTFGNVETYRLDKLADIVFENAPGIFHWASCVTTDAGDNYDNVGYFQDKAYVWGNSAITPPRSSHIK